MMDLIVGSFRTSLQGDHVDSYRPAPMRFLKITQDQFSQTGLLLLAVAFGGMTGLEQSFRLDLAEDQDLAVEQDEVGLSLTRSVVLLEKSIS